MTPLVTIGIPTYNRKALLRRALASAVAQDYPAVEVLVSDNGSTDGTEALCREVAAGEPRIRYVRQHVNVGATSNFRSVLAEACGDYFMWLSDDDVIAPNYVSECVAVLEAEPDVDLVGGKALLVSRDGRVIEEDVSITLDAEQPAARVLGYYRRVGRNSLFFGVGRTAALQAQAPLANLIGGDWLMLAGVAYGGKIRTVPTAGLTRSVEGTSDDLRRAARSLRLGWLPETLPRLALARTVAGDLLRSPVYRDLGGAQRAVLALRCALSTAWRVGLRYHLARMAAPWLRRRDQRKSRSALSRSETVSSPDTGQSMASEGSSHRTPADASGA